MNDSTDNLFQEQLVLVQSDLRAFIFSLLPFHSNDVSEVLQETNLALIAAQKNYDSARPFRPWALSFAKRCVLAYFHDISRERVLFSSAAIERLAESYADERSNADPTLDRQSNLLVRLRLCRQRLGKKDSHILTLFYDREQKIRQIAAELNCRENTIRVTLNRIRERLGRCVRALCQIPDDSFERNHPTVLDEAIDAAIEDRPVPSKDLLKGASALADQLETADLLRYSDRLLIHSLLMKEKPVEAQPLASPKWKLIGLAASLMVAVGLLSWGGILFLSTEPSAKVSSTLASPMKVFSEGPVSDLTFNLPAAQISVDVTSPAPVTATAPSASSQTRIPSSGPKATTPATYDTKKGETQMKTTTKLVAATVLSGVAALGSASVLSDPIRIDSAPTNSPYWRTVWDKKMTIGWDWPSGANAAILTITAKSTGAQATHLLTTSVSSFSWEVGLPQDDNSEEVFDLLLAFYTDSNGAGEPIEGQTLTATNVGRVRGLQGSGTRLLTEGRDDILLWDKVWDGYTVLPILAGTTDFSIDGVAIPFNYTPSWHLWKGIKNKQTYNLQLWDSSNSYTAAVTGKGRGTQVIFN